MSGFPKWEYAHLEYKTIDHFRDLAKMIIVGGGERFIQRHPSTTEKIL